MTLQWTAVASFLYVEVGCLLLLCLPFISPPRWLQIFNFRFWRKIASYWNRAFLTIIIILVVLFFDAVREVRKYSASHTVEKDAKLFPNVYDHFHMKLFRAQRNLYISGFSLFLWLVLRRVITLISELAVVMGDNQILNTQAADCNDAAKKHMEENEELKKAINRGKGQENENLVEENDKLNKEIGKLQTEVQETTEALEKSQKDMMAMTTQCEGLTREYDSLVQEHDKLQSLVDSPDKKNE
ncbi:tRNA-dihydrouridine(20a/20b) synthase [NAD(P)+]-like isoform X2 [Callorhinchus milii]|uniref:Endoplasmic reticulum transmembrane protein n=2 Tax=Callorhinchus milii TaxID=7868 RepID=V9KE76_CALMI|nr:tRNA-dihydrouridine(20a/20b) synthase [NAD(P)+]-like isoform X2 [Callorhinchus milii]|eukprot:gi/632981987/ref/XP_007907889.1/ PREDICTED: B-cell receptor-associated protein 29 [Callorhinchus milii]